MSMNLEYLSKIGGRNVCFIELLVLDKNSLLFYTIDTNPHKTLKTAASEKIKQIDYFTLRDLDRVNKKKIKNNLMNFLNKTLNYADREKEEKKLDTDKTAFDIVEEVKTAKINFYRPEKTIPINDYINMRAKNQEKFSENEIIGINAFLAKTYKDYYGFCEYIAGLRDKN